MRTQKVMVPGRREIMGRHWGGTLMLIGKPNIFLRISYGSRFPVTTSHWLQDIYYKWENGHKIKFSVFQFSHHVENVANRTLQTPCVHIFVRCTVHKYSSASYPYSSVTIFLKKLITRLIATTFTVEAASPVYIKLVLLQYLQLCNVWLRKSVALLL